MKLLTAISLILASGLTFANPHERKLDGFKLSKEKCTDIDIRDKATPEIKEHYSNPIDQGNIGWCYGYSATDLLSFEVGKPLSPTHVSSIYNKSIRSNLFWKAGYNIMRLFGDRQIYEGGFSNKAAREGIKASPICGYDVKDEKSDFVEILEEVRSRVINKEFDEDLACKVLNELVPSIDTKSEDFMKEFINRDLNDTLESMLRKSCQHLIEIPKKEVKMYWPPVFYSKSGQRKYAEKINGILNQGKPLSVAYNTSHISPSIRGFHASTVIGRRWNNNRCEYNIKNTWGRLCGPDVYKADIECNEDDGSYWVKDETLFDMSLNFTYLQ